MIDIENQVFTRIAQALRASFPGIIVKGEQDLSPAQFPTVTIDEIDNYAYRRTQDTGTLENHSAVVYEVNVYSNKAVGKKTESKSIFQIIDQQFERMGFTRQMKRPISLDDTTKYRMIGRYSALVGKDHKVYRR